MTRVLADARLITGQFFLEYRAIEAERSNVKSRYGICYDDGTIKIRLAHADGTALSHETRVVVDATMPLHHHGMNRVPKIETEGDGRWRARGMLFHMPGEWELTIDLFERGVSERAVFALELEP